MLQYCEHGRSKQSHVNLCNEISCIREWARSTFITMLPLHQRTYNYADSVINGIAYHVTGWKCNEGIYVYDKTNVEWYKRARKQWMIEDVKSDVSMRLSLMNERMNICKQLNKVHLFKLLNHTDVDRYILSLVIATIVII